MKDGINIILAQALFGHATISFSENIVDHTLILSSY